MSYRVIQWYTGEIAKKQIRMIQAHPDLELVGAVVFHSEKDGLDVGQIAGIGPIGIKATMNREKALSIKADCVLYNAPYVQQDQWSEIIRILESGKNVISPVAGWYPKIFPDTMKRIEKACKTGNSTLVGCGINPGLVGDLIALIATSLTSEIRRIHFYEAGDMSFYHEPTSIQVMGFGQKPEDLKGAEEYASYMTEAYQQEIHLLADGLSWKVEDIQTSFEYAPAKRDFTVGGLEIKKGTVAGIRLKVTGIVNGSPTIVFEMVWVMDLSLGPNWPGEEVRATEGEKNPGYTVTIEGDPNIKVAVHYYGCGTIVESSLVATACRMVNTIPVACESAPGVLTFLDSQPAPRAFKPSHVK